MNTRETVLAGLIRLADFFVCRSVFLKMVGCVGRDCLGVVFVCLFVSSADRLFVWQLVAATAFRQ